MGRCTYDLPEAGVYETVTIRVLHSVKESTHGRQYPLQQYVHSCRTLDLQLDTGHVATETVLRSTGA